MASRQAGGLYATNDWRRPVGSKSGGPGIEPYRTSSRKDFARLIHCPSFRRLQGKTQLFPSHESDFFRNRLTHSLEVAQIAKSIAIKFNNKDSYFVENPIDVDLVEFAALAHDLGHPPFGHNGENVLDRLMIDHGGFEGNAQTLRLIGCIEKKETTNFPTDSAIPIKFDSMTDLRRGLNLTYRTLASVLKYDRQIPATRAGRAEHNCDKQPCKGYYGLEGPLVQQIKAHVISESFAEPFKTIECSIMDVADDIAYSTYDIEDSFKAGFLAPLQMMAASDDFKSSIAKRVKHKIDSDYAGHPSQDRDFTVDHVNTVLAGIFGNTLEPPDASRKRLSQPIELNEAAFILATTVYGGSKEIGENGYLRTSFTSQLVGKFIRDVEVIKKSKNPQLWQAQLSLGMFKTVETLKSFSFQQLISSPRLKLAEKRGTEIIEKLFEAFVGDARLLPDDWREVYQSKDDLGWHRRTVCDYIAGMTDRYCVEMYVRLTGQDPMTIWKPH